MTQSAQAIIEDYKTHLQRAFWHISKDHSIRSATDCPTITTSCEQIYQKLKSIDSAKYWSFTIDPPWIMPLRNSEGYFSADEAYLVIGGEFTVKDFVVVTENYYLTIIRKHGSKTQYVSCCEKDHNMENRIVRRYHFDKCEGDSEKYEANNHVHFGGTIEDLASFCHYVGGEGLHYCLDNNLDPPRFPYPPLDFVLMIDLFLHQFQTSINKNFLNTNEWIEIVKKSEDFQLKQYYDAITKYYSDKLNKRIDKHSTILKKLCEKGFSN